MSLATVALVTPSYGPDLRRCEFLVESVRRCRLDVDHYLIVDRVDRSLFEHLRSGRTRLMEAESLMPNDLRRLPGETGAWLTPTSMPIRGWIVQQLLKLACAQQLHHDTLVYCDSDMFFVRPFDLTNLQAEGKIGLLDVDYQSPEIHLWSVIACELLGIEANRVEERGHVNTMVCWNRSHVLTLIDRIQSRSSVDWRHRIGRLRKFSECTLYGIYVREVLGYDNSAHAPTNRPLVHGSWGFDLAEPAGMSALFADLDPETVAVMVHSKDGFEPAAYRRHAERYWNGST